MFELIESLLFGFLFFTPAVLSCGGWTPPETTTSAGQIIFSSDCDNYIDTSERVEFDPFLGQYTVLWYGNAYSTYFLEQIDHAIDYTCSLTAAQRDNVEFVFVNSHSYADFFYLLEQRLNGASNCGSVQVKQATQSGEWSWTHYQGAANTARIFDPNGFFADYYGTYGSRHSSLASSTAPIKRTLNSLLDGTQQSPCWDRTTTPPETHELTLTFTQVAGGCENNQPMIQLSEIAFYGNLNDANAQQNRILCVRVEDQLGDSPSNEVPSRANDENISTKWLDRSFGDCNSQFICGLPSLPQYYRLTTANDATQRDPTEWTLRVCDISTDICFTASETVNNPPTNRRTVYPEIFSMIVTDEPTRFPTTDRPTEMPSKDPTTEQPSYNPTKSPFTTIPSNAPTGAPVSLTPYACQEGYGSGDILESLMMNSYTLCAAMCDANAQCAGFDYTTSNIAYGEACRLFGIDVEPEFGDGGALNRQYCDSNEQFYFTIDIEEIRECTSTMMQLSEVIFYQGEREVTCNKIGVVPENSPDAELVGNLVDGSPGTKWLQLGYSCKMPLAVAGKLEAMPDSYTFRTANDYYYRDPVTWNMTICGGTDGRCMCDSQVNVDAPSARRSLYQTFSLSSCVTTANPTSEPTDSPTALTTSLPETTFAPTEIPSIAPTLQAPSHTPLPFPEGDIVTLRRRVDDLQDRVELCVEKLDAVLGVEAILQECQADSSDFDDTAFDPYDYKSETWYQELKATTDVTYLSNADFTTGTYQITTPGRYVFSEDIVFDPNPDNDGFPVIGDPRFPMNKYFLGFFAAITIETSDVWIDLNGYSIVQSEHHNAMQRFYNHIELADRVFIKFEGMASLNYQTNDKIQYNEESPQRHGSINSASRVIISGGTLGKSSHNGVHGNGASHIVMENLNVINFEVAGLQVNGGDNIAIVDCQVGPSNQNVIFSAQWSNAVIMKHYVTKFIPYSMSKFGTMDLMNEVVTFADRPNEEKTFQQVFDDLVTGVDAYTQHSLYGTDVDDVLVTMFNNTARLPDGSAIYGIFLHRLGLGAEMWAKQDENYLGPEHENIVIRNVVIRDLQIAPRIIPSLVHNDGTIIQGPARDVIQFLSVMKESPLMGIQEATYSGNILVDAYIAMAKLSEKFYRAYIYDSECGNFASNVTSSFVRNAEDCNGVKMNPSLTGRDIHMIQKRIFGGLKISQGFMDWATIPGTTFESLLKTEVDYTARRQTKHNIVCYHDALFHPNKGIAGLRLEFLQNVLIDNVDILDLYNSGDADHWLCSRKYRLFSTQEEIMAFKNQPGRHQGPNIRGISMGKTEGVEVHNVNIDNLRSLEGAVFGFNIGVDTSDRTDYETPSVSLDYSNINIGTLVGGAGHLVRPYESQLTSANTGEIAISEEGVPEIHFEFDNAKLSVSFEQKPAFDINNAESAAEFLSLYEVDEAFMYDLNRQYEKFMRVTYALDLGFDYNAPWWQVPVDPEGKWRIVNAMQIGDVYFVCRKGDCQLPSGDAKCRERYLALIPNEEFTVYGTYGGTGGKTVYPGEFLLAGHYRMNGVTDHTLDINYFGECPLSHTTMMYDGVGDPHRISYMQNCAVQSEELGVGISIGLMGGFCSNDVQPGFFPTGAALMTFDDAPDLYVEDDNYEKPDFLIEQSVMWASVADGTIPITPGRSGILTHPYTKGYHMPNEAALKYFRKWLSFTDDEIREFRHEVLEFYRDHCEVPAINVETQTLEPLDNSIDLGGGNSIIPYTVTDAAEHHLVGTKRSTGATMTNARVHEVGFALNVGRAGIWTYAGHVEYGGLIQYGYYIIEYEDGSTEAIKFYDHYPQIPNSNAHYAVVQRIIHPVHGLGKLHGLAKTMPTADGNGAKLEFRMNWYWETP